MGWGSLLVASVIGLALPRAHAQVSLGALETAYTQNFDAPSGLSSTGTSSATPAGWVFFETGTGANANGMYVIGSGSSGNGDTYSFGASGSTERAFGTVRSGTVIPTIGASFTNATGAAIGSITIAYHGEEWRLGAVGRTDRLDFQYSLDATSLSTGAWTDVDALDFTTPDTTSATGAQDGNASGHQIAITGTFSLALPAGATVFIRWNDLSITGAQDGLAVDDFSLTPHGTVSPPVVDVAKMVTAPTPAGPTSVLDYAIDVAVSSGQGITSAVFTDTLPAGVTVSGTTFTLDSTVGSPTTLTIAADGDAGEIVGGVVTVRLPDLGVGDIASVGFSVVVSPRAADGTITNSAQVTCNGVVSGTGLVFTSNTTSTNVVACVTTASGSIPLCVGDVLFDVFFDANGNGTHDTGEPGIGGWGISLDGGAGSQVTAADGSATFTGLTAGQMYDVTGNTPPAAAGTWSAPFPPGVFSAFGTTRTYHVAITCTCPDDGDACTNPPVCDVGACGAPTPVFCDDTNPCTDDACAGGGCTHTNNTASCDDGSASTRDDVCGGGSCAGTAYTCTPGVCESTSVPNGVDCTITYASATTACGASGGCDRCEGSSGTCVATTCGVDAGTDAAVVADDAGTDAAVASEDAGLDAGADDAAVAVDAGTGADAGVDAGADAGARDGSTGGDASSPGADTGTSPPVMSASCGCRTTGRGAPSALGLGLLGLAILARRRLKTR